MYLDEPRALYSVPLAVVVADHVVVYLYEPRTLYSVPPAVVSSNCAVRDQKVSMQWSPGQILNDKQVLRGALGAQRAAISYRTDRKPNEIWTDGLWVSQRNL